MRTFLMLALLLPATALAQPVKPADPAAVDKMIAETFPTTSPEWHARTVQDETQRICSLRRNEPTQAEAAAIMKREAATVVYPADGKVIGNWKAGEKIAQSGQGNQFSDKPGTVAGGNCYACHQLAPTEISYGTLGPSLLNYGRIKDFSPEAARAAYAKVYNAQAVFACTTMPRFGHNHILTEQQMKDVVAFLFDPASPVNAPAK